MAARSRFPNPWSETRIKSWLSVYSTIGRLESSFTAKLRCMSIYAARPHNNMSEVIKVLSAILPTTPFINWATDCTNSEDQRTAKMGNLTKLQSASTIPHETQCTHFCEHCQRTLSPSHPRSHDVEQHQDHNPQLHPTTPPPPRRWSTYTLFGIRIFSTSLAIALLTLVSLVTARNVGFRNYASYVSSLYTLILNVLAIVFLFLRRSTIQRISGRKIGGLGSVIPELGGALLALGGLVEYYFRIDAPWGSADVAGYQSECRHARDGQLCVNWRIVHRLQNAGRVCLCLIL